MGTTQLQEQVEIIFPENGLEKKLQTAATAGRQLIVKLGFDPTAPDLHLGHAVVLKKMKQFQDLGHRIVIVIGDFTARIGDPTGRNKSRPPLSAAEVEHNAQTYVRQLSKILDVSRCEIRYNAEWLEKMDMAAVIRLLSGTTLAQIMHRTDFQQRFQQQTPIAMHELIYPLLQGFDSVQIKADIEMGGTDQLFNCTMGRQLQEARDLPAQIVMCMPLLRGIDGTAKMSKSQHNIIGLTDTPDEMFGKMMSVPDALLPDYIRMTTDFSRQEQDQLLQQLTAGENPMRIKKAVGSNLVQQYHSKAAATAAQLYFEKQFQQQSQADKVFAPVSWNSLPGVATIGLIELCKQLLPAESKSSLRRLVLAGGIQVNGQKCLDINTTFTPDNLPLKLKLGKRSYFEIIA
ncbi:tyrosine--tRNA ligase [Chitinophaga nivalis]|uniref:Tyrosine--tRNA ligase n=1 Tax=Chitinophaga nivalis TaxID=2991709 RepID=A0ABT3IGI4_9BACT|nr:tyrosine--tRNA ligase [Chitinophaga nivalis]MCW3467228.1 tyrosine--tRNA ligase [Chitinophaga nivalis]MCW3483080.1 tyrosine--tRNA ligase [Chitinophaga nivalis]